MCVCVYIYTCMYICKYVYMYVYIYRYTQMYTYMYIYVYTQRTPTDDQQKDTKHKGRRPILTIMFVRDSRSKQLDSDRLAAYVPEGYQILKP
jgi:hypothetical protein